MQILINSHVSLCSLHKGRLNVFTTLLQKQLSQCHAALHMYSKQSREFGTAARSHSQSTWLNRCSDGKQPLCCSNYLTSVWAVKCADSAGGWRVCKHLGIMDVDAQNESWKLRRKTRRGFWCRICAAINWRRMWRRAEKEDLLKGNYYMCVSVQKTHTRMSRYNSWIGTDPYFICSFILSSTVWVQHSFEAFVQFVFFNLCIGSHLYTVYV